MALVGATQIGLKDTSSNASITDDPKARLMYYLDCVCCVLNLDGDGDINRLRKHQYWYVTRFCL